MTGRRAVEIDGLWPALAAAPRFVFFRAFILAGDNFHEQLVVGKLLLAALDAFPGVPRKNRRMWRELKLDTQTPD